MVYTLIWLRIKIEEVLSVRLCKENSFQPEPYGF